VSSLTVKQLRATIALAAPNAVFAGTNSNKLILTGLRMTAVVQAVARSAPTADIRIYGMLPADSNALTVVFLKNAAVQKNAILLEANEGNGWTQVFSGVMFEAQPDYRGAPDAFFRTQAIVSYFSQINPVPPLSYPVATSVATVVQGLAAQMGFAFENNGVTATLAAGAYFPGTAYDQLQRVCQATDTDFYFDGGTLAIVPSGLGRPNVPSVVLNPQSGLIGYPTIERFGITIDALYNPGFAGGGKVQVQGSDIPAANGIWTPFSLTHTLQAVTPDGAWFTTLRCVKYGTPIPDAVA
jgi:hypothetical protein